MLLEVNARREDLHVCNVDLSSECVFVGRLPGSSVDELVQEHEDDT